MSRLVTGFDYDKAHVFNIIRNYTIHVIVRINIVAHSLGYSIYNETNNINAQFQTKLIPPNKHNTIIINKTRKTAQN